MKIRFKSTRKEWKSDKDDFVFDFTAELVREIEEDGFTSLTFDEDRNGQKITNRIEYNEDTIRIFSGVTSLTCKLNEITKNLLRIDGINQDFSIYTKMNEMKTNSNHLEFKYLISNSEEFNEYTSIHLELFVIEN